VIRPMHLKGASSAMSDWSGSLARAAVGGPHLGGSGTCKAAPTLSGRRALFADGVPGSASRFADRLSRRRTG
jgi:hypothetical protein